MGRENSRTSSSSKGMNGEGEETAAAPDRFPLPEGRKKESEQSVGASRSAGKEGRKYRDDYVHVAKKKEKESSVVGRGRAGGEGGGGSLPYLISPGKGRDMKDPETEKKKRKRGASSHFSTPEKKKPETKKGEKKKGFSYSSVKESFIRASRGRRKE